MFWKENIIIVILILWIGPLILFFIWLGFQKHKDVIALSKAGIETENHGVINWKDIKVCSWVTFYSTNCILLILKGNKWLYITYPKYSLESLDQLTALLNEIKTFQNQLSEGRTFKIVENDISFWGINVKFVIMILGIIGLIIINIIKELQNYFKY